MACHIGPALPEGFATSEPQPIPQLCDSARRAAQFGARSFNLSVRRKGGEELLLQSDLTPAPRQLMMIRVLVDNVKIPNGAL